MFTKIYTWARKFLFTEIPSRCQAWWAGITGRLSSFFRLLRQSPRALFAFLASVLIPGLVVLAFFVILPVIHNPFDAAAPEVDEEAAKAADETAAASDSSREQLYDKLLALQTEQAYRQARLQLAKSDSISLTIDLRDSVASLEVKGVPMRRCKIHAYELSSALQRLRAQNRLHQWLATPFVLRRQAATLPKAPIRVVEAPQDTLEAQLRATEEITLEQRDVHFTLEFDRNLTVAIEQVQTPSFSGWLRKLLYSTRRILTEAWEALGNLSQKRLPEHHMLIELQLTQEDAKAIYRALPGEAGLALYF